MTPRDAARFVRIGESTRTPLRRAIGALWLLVDQLAQDIVSAICIGADTERRHRGAVFFAQGFEHAVVNMFTIPTGMLLGAKVTWSDWWLWNQIPVTLGNIVGGFVFTGPAIYLTYKPRPTPESSPLPVPTRVPAE